MYLLRSERRPATRCKTSAWALSIARCCRSRSQAAADHRARCPECEGPAAIRGEGAGRRAQRAHRADRRHGVRPVERLRRADPHADGGAPGQERAPVQPVPHHGALLADPCRAALRPQPSHVQHGLDHRDRHRLPRPDRAAAQQRGSAGRDAPAERLRHRRLRQVARDRGLGGQHLGPDQSLADPLRLRQVLRVHRRRGQSVGAGDLRRDEPDRAAEGTELPFPDRHDRQGDRLGQGREIAHAGQAVLHLLTPRAPRTLRTTCRRSGSPSTRASSTRAGTSCAKRRWPGRRSSAWSRRTPSSHPSRRRSRIGTS